LPDAWVAGHYAQMQGGTNADVVLADAVVKKLPGIDLQLAYEAASKNATVPSDSPAVRGRYLAEYLHRGYVTHYTYKNAVSRTMEYAYNDFCIAQMADRLGKKSDAMHYKKQASNVFRLFYDSVGYFWARDTLGNWEPEFTLHSKLAAYWDDPYFYEGGSEVYSYYVPHDMAGLIRRHGGAHAFAQRLDAFFDSGRFKLENEPLFLVPYSYNYAGMPYKTAQRVRHILTHAFRPGHEGLPGQDDSGAMSAWYVFSAMGFFPVAGQPLYLIGSPLFEQVSLQVGQGRTFAVHALGNSPKHIYVQRALLNGKPLNRNWLTHEEITKGGLLQLYMGAQPSRWGSTNLPYSLSTEKP
jgi:predicted alpha-1,2-mannosidase